MRVLFAAATGGELPEEFGAAGKPSGEAWSLPTEKTPGVHIDVVITGVGQVSAALVLGKLFQKNHYDLAINPGVAGSFTDELKPVDVVVVCRDAFGDLGAEDDTIFLPLRSLGLQTAFPGLFIDGWLEPAVPELASVQTLQRVSAITVNKVHGRWESIAETRRHFDPQTESMEGAAFFLAAMQAGIPCLQVRAISNRVEKRDRSAWKLEEALNALNKITRSLLHDFATFGYSR